MADPTADRHGTGPDRTPLIVSIAIQVELALLGKPGTTTHLLMDRLAAAAGGCAAQGIPFERVDSDAQEALKTAAPHLGAELLGELRATITAALARGYRGEDPAVEA